MDVGITQEDVGGLEGVSNRKRAKVCSTFGKMKWKRSMGPKIKILAINWSFFDYNHQKRRNSLDDQRRRHAIQEAFPVAIGVCYCACARCCSDFTCGRKPCSFLAKKA